MGFIKLDDEVSEKMRRKYRPAEPPPRPWQDNIETALKELGKFVFFGILSPIILLAMTLLERRREMKRDRLEFKYEDIDEQIEVGGFRRFEFAYQAGKWFGYRPKPDTHVFSCKVNFLEIPRRPGNIDAQAGQQGSILQESSSIEISIFPSLSGMIFGTLVGSVLGTFTRNDFSFSDPYTDPARFWQNMQILFVSSIFGFITGIVLMRRKDVQSFITIEDLWGGILIGFIVAYSGRDVFERLLNVGPNSNEILPSMNETLSSLNNTLSGINNTLANVD